MTGRLFVLVVVDIDTSAIVEDNVPENLVDAVKDEILSHLGESSVRGALGIVDQEIIDVWPRIGRRG